MQDLILQSGQGEIQVAQLEGAVKQIAAFAQVRQVPILDIRCSRWDRKHEWRTKSPAGMLTVCEVWEAGAGHMNSSSVQPMLRKDRK